MIIVNLALRAVEGATRLAPEGSALHTVGVGIRAYRTGNTVGHLVDGLDGVVGGSTATAGAGAAGGTNDPATSELPVEPEAGEPTGIVETILNLLGGEG